MPICDTLISFCFFVNTFHLQNNVTSRKVPLYARKVPLYARKVPLCECKVPIGVW